MAVISEKSLAFGHDSPCQRQYHRLLIPLNVTIDGQLFGMDNWSMSGFCIKDPPASMSPDDVFTARVDIPFQGFQVKFSARVSVVRKNSLDKPKPSSQSDLLPVESAQTEAGLEFLNLNERQRSLLQHFSEQLLTGQMAKIDDTICRLDIPVTPPSTDLQTFTGNKTTTEKNSWLTGIAYLASGLILTLLIGATVYHKLCLLEIESAVVSATLEHPQTPVSGTISEIYVRPGDFLEPATNIMKINSPELEEAKELAVIRIKELQLKLAEIKAVEQTELRELEIYRKFSMDKLSAAKRRVQALTRKMALLKRDGQSKKNLAEKGMLSRLEQDQAQLRFISTEKELTESKAALTSAETFMNATDHGIYFTDGKRELNIAARQAQIEHALAQVKLEQQKLALLKRREQSLMIKTVHGGIVSQMNKEIGETVTTHEPLARINRGNEALTIDAYLTQIELTQIHLSSTAEIYIPALDHHYQASVSEIDGSQYFVSDINTGMNWANAEQRSGRVILTVLDSKSVNHKQQLTPGLPAIVRFQRYSLALADFNFFSFTRDKPSSAQVTLKNARVPAL